MSALRARIQELHSERDELEVPALYMRKIEEELKREKTSFNKLVLSMNEAKEKALEIQEREIRTKKMAIAQEELKKYQVEASRWSARIQNLEAQLDEMGVSDSRVSLASLKELEPPRNDDAFRQHQPIQNSNRRTNKEYHVGGDRHYASYDSDGKYSEDEHINVSPEPKGRSAYRTAPSQKQMQDLMRVLHSIPGFKDNRKCKNDIEEVMRALKQNFKGEPNVPQLQAMMEMFQRMTINGRR